MDLCFPRSPKFSCRLATDRSNCSQRPMLSHTIITELDLTWIRIGHPTIWSYDCDYDERKCYLCDRWCYVLMITNQYVWCVFTFRTTCFSIGALVSTRKFLAYSFVMFMSALTVEMCVAVIIFDVQVDWYYLLYFTLFFFLFSGFIQFLIYLECGCDQNDTSNNYYNFSWMNLCITLDSWIICYSCFLSEITF